MIRREFITLLGGAAVAWPLAARAQQAKLVRLEIIVTQLQEIAAMHLVLGQALPAGQGDRTVAGDTYVQGGDLWRSRRIPRLIGWRSDRYRALASNVCDG